MYKDPNESLSEKIAHRIAQYHGSIAWGIYMNQYANDWPLHDMRPPTTKEFIIAYAKEVKRRADAVVLGLFICRARGHAWEVHGYAGPESGGEEWECTRCGEYGSVTYY